MISCCTRHRRAARALALWLVLAWSWGCSSYQRTAPSALRPGSQTVAVTFRQPRAMAEHQSGRTVPVTRVWGPLERVSGDTLFLRVAGGANERGKQVRLARSDVPLAVVITDAETVDARRFSGGRTALAVIGTLGVILAIMAATVCVMCDFGDGSSY